MDSLFEDDVNPVEDGMDIDNYAEDEEITQEDAWVVIDQYFIERGMLIWFWSIKMIALLQYCNTARYLKITFRSVKRTFFQDLSSYCN